MNMIWHYNILVYGYALIIGWKLKNMLICYLSKDIQRIWFAENTLFAVGTYCNEVVIKG